MGSDDPATQTLLVDCGELHAGIGTVDALARLQLEARRCGFELRLTGSSAELRELIEFAGLAEALPEASPLGVEPGR